MTTREEFEEMVEAVEESAVAFDLAVECGEDREPAERQLAHARERIMSAWDAQAAELERERMRLAA